jgi:hypothetical protein
MTSKSDDDDDDLPSLNSESEDDDESADEYDHTYHEHNEIKQQRRQILALKRQLEKKFQEDLCRQNRIATLEDNMSQGWLEIQSLRDQLATTPTSTTTSTSTTDSKRKHLTAPAQKDIVAATVALIDERDISLIKYRLMANLFRNMPRVEEIQAFRNKLNDQIKAKLNIHACPPDTPGVWVSPKDAVRLMMADHPSDSTAPYQLLLAMDGAKLSRSSNHVTPLSHYYAINLMHSSHRVWVQFPTSLSSYMSVRFMIY